MWFDWAVDLVLSFLEAERKRLVIALSVGEKNTHICVGKTEFLKETLCHMLAVLTFLTMQYKVSVAVVFFVLFFNRISKHSNPEYLKDY